MSIQAIAQVLEYELNDVSAKAVLIGLANHVSPEGECYPSVRRLMRYTGLSERAVRETIRRLESDLQLITVTREPGKRSRYHLHLPTPAADAGVVVQQMQGTPAGDAGHNRKEPKKEPSDARAGLPDDWKPKPSLMSKLDYDYPNVDIGEQVKLFVLHNQAKGTVLVDPDAAFQMWMKRTGSLKLPVKGRSVPAPAAGGLGDPAALARGQEQKADMLDKVGDKDGASEQYLLAARGYHRIGSTEQAITMGKLAHKTARKDSWAAEQAKKFLESIDGSPEDQADKGQRDTDSPAADG